MRRGSQCAPWLATRESYSTGGREFVPTRCALLVPEERPPLRPLGALGLRRGGSALSLQGSPPGLRPWPRKQQALILAAPSSWVRATRRTERTQAGWPQLQRQWGAAGRAARVGPETLSALVHFSSPRVSLSSFSRPTHLIRGPPSSLHSSTLWSGSRRTQVHSVPRERNRTHNKLDSTSLNLSRLINK